MKKVLYTILVLLTILFATLLYGRFLGTTGLKTKEIVLEEDIVKSYDGLKIIHFSDLHYKKVITEKRVKNLITEINKTKPDLVLFTGDLLDNYYTIKNQDINFLIKELKKIKSTYGNYAILGDNDYKNEEVVKNIYLQSNITLLRNDYTTIHNENNDTIFLAGLESANQDKASLEPITTYLNEHPNINYQIFLIHEPDYSQTILSTINPSLILAGHSINGSINLPGIKQLLLPIGAKKYYKPNYEKNNTSIYISNGIGVNNINFRLFNTPSINFYRIKKRN